MIRDTCIRILRHRILNPPHRNVLFLLAFWLLLPSWAASEPGEPAIIKPWRQIHLDPEYSGAWVVAGDLTGDGSVEILTARNVDQNDVHYTSAVVAQRLDGSVLWRWGNPKIGRRELHHDVPCQIYDWDGDGRREVVLCAKDQLVELDGATGKENRRFALPKAATDCLVFANLSGGPRATDVLVKTRYDPIWAFDYDGKQLWTVKNPGRHRTSHQAVPIDLDGDGRHEIMAGYAMLNSDGTTRWVFESKAVDQDRGHCDCFRIVKPGNSVRNSRYVMTLYGANCISMLNGEGQTIWEVAGHHFESINVGRVIPGSSVQFVVDIDHRPWGEGPILVLDEHGSTLTRIMTDYARHHALVDWTGDGVSEIVVAQPRTLYDGNGKSLARFGMDANDDLEGEERLVRIGDFTGDGVPDVLLTTRSISCLSIYRNEQGMRPNPRSPLGTGVNVTLYRKSYGA